MKKDLDWLNNEVEKRIGKIKTDEVSFAGSDYFDEGYIHGMRDVQAIANQLDEPEVLSQEWVSDNAVVGQYPDGMGYVVPAYRLQNLLVPEQELPVIPKFVAEFLIGKEDYILYELFDDEWLYKEHYRVAKWLYDNDELTNRQREIDLVMARDRGYVVEEERKYYIRDQHGVYLLAKNHREQGKVQTVAEIVEQYGIEEIELDYELTEQEIKDYDERYLAFKVPVEEMEE